VQALYALAICLSIPLQLFPAIRITENALFSKSGKHNPLVKWQKNMFRFMAVLACACVAIVGSGDLDKFVSLGKETDLVRKKTNERVYFE
jgi:proton-coupled amino acid transporter